MTKIQKNEDTSELIYILCMHYKSSNLQITYNTIVTFSMHYNKCNKQRKAPYELIPKAFYVPKKIEKKIQTIF